MAESERRSEIRAGGGNGQGNGERRDGSSPKEDGERAHAREWGERAGVLGGEGQHGVEGASKKKLKRKRQQWAGEYET